MRDRPASSSPPACRLSVVVPAYNEERLIGRCLTSIAEAAAAVADRIHPVEIIVCDNASTDTTAAQARAHRAVVVHEPVRQIARARNRGAAAAVGEWLLFFDADSVACPDLFRALAEAMADPRCLGGGALVELEGNRGYGLWLARLWNLISRLLRWAPGGFLFCRADAFRELGGFNEELFVSEELDLSRRLKSLGRRRRQRMMILRGVRLVTSGRKLDLYSPAETLRFALRYLGRPGRVARDREACPIWYDGRR